jgi:hypothetical protein
MRSSMQHAVCVCLPFRLDVQYQVRYVGFRWGWSDIMSLLCYGTRCQFELVSSLCYLSRLIYFICIIILFLFSFCWLDFQILCIIQKLPNCGAQPPGGASCLYEGHIYFERNMGARQKVYFDRHFAWLKYFTFLLVPVLALNHKQHILSPVKGRKVRYSLA